MAVRFFRKAMGKRGVSLLELMVVLGVIGIIAAVAIPGYLGGMPRRRLNASAMDIASNLKLARMRSVSSGTNWGVFFDTINNRYTLFEDTNGDDTYNAGEEDAIRNNVELETGITISATTFANNAAVFQRNGTCAGGQVTLSNGADTRLIDVSTTGRVRIP